VVEQFLREHAVADVLAQAPVVFPLRLIEELIVGRLPWEGMRTVVAADIFRLSPISEALYTSQD
jgi:hypothetical protein